MVGRFREEECFEEGYHCDWQLCKVAGVFPEFLSMDLDFIGSNVGQVAFTDRSLVVSFR